MSDNSFESCVAMVTQFKSVKRQGLGQGLERTHISALVMN